MQTARAIVVDRERLACRGMRRTLQADPRLQIVAEACTVREAIRVIEAHHPDVVVIADRLPGLRGLVLISTLRVERPDIASVLLADQIDADTWAAAAEAGASDLTGRNSAAAEIVQAVITAVAGSDLLYARAMEDPKIMSRLLAIARTGNTVAWLGNRFDSTLTLRQLGVLDGIVMAMTNREIAQEEGIAEQTVKHHVSALNRTLGARDRIGVLRQAILRGWTSLGSAPARYMPPLRTSAFRGDIHHRRTRQPGPVVAAHVDDLLVSQM